MRIIKQLIPYIVILIVVVIIRTFLVTPVMVTGTSMEETLHKNQILLLNKFDHNFKRFDIIVFNYNDSKLIKRIIGFPGETIKYENGILYIDGKLVEDKFASITPDFTFDGVVPTDHYFVLGDNRTNSSDSRVIGPISKDKLLGTTTFSLWPIKFVK